MISEPRTSVRAVHATTRPVPKAQSSLPVKTTPYQLPRTNAADVRAQADVLLDQMEGRRSCRHFSDEPIPRDLIETVIRIAHSAPSGANRKPWRFVAIDDTALKRDIRLAAEAEERENYDRRFPPQWLEALEPIGTDASKPFLEIAPWLVVVFRIDRERVGNRWVKSYYPVESVGIAAGMLLTACHQLGLATLTHTPSPMGFLRELLGRPKEEKPFLLIPIGYPAPQCAVPDIPKKTRSAALQWNNEPNLPSS